MPFCSEVHKVYFVLLMCNIEKIQAVTNLLSLVYDPVYFAFFLLFAFELVYIWKLEWRLASGHPRKLL